MILYINTRTILYPDDFIVKFEKQIYSLRRWSFIVDEVTVLLLYTL